MNGTSALRLSGTLWGKSQTSVHEVIVFLALLSGPLHNEPALADDCPAPSFAAPVIYDGGAVPHSLAFGDFNGDGKIDLAETDYSSGTASVLFGNGDGTFQSPLASATGPSPYSMVVDDFNGDGWLDVAVANYSFSGNLSVLLGNGDGTFRSPAKYAVGALPTSVAAGDFNRDGHPDLVTANNYSDGISVLPGNGDGTFQTGVVSGPDNAANGSAVATDFNGDGKLDLAWARSTPGDAAGADLWVLVGNGDGTFQASRIFWTVPYIPSVAVADLNGDGMVDLAASTPGPPPNYYTNGGISVFLGKGDGSFGAAFAYAAGATPSSVAVSDFNGDGKPDLAGALAGAGRIGVAVLLNTCAFAGINLSVARIYDNVTVSWPLPFTNFVLEFTPAPGSTNWQQVSETMTTSNGCCEVNVPLDQAQRYFRLRKP